MSQIIDPQSACSQWRFRTYLLGAFVLAGSLLLVAAAPVAHAQARDSAFKTLTLGELYVEGQRNSPKVQASRALARAVRARVPSAGLPPDPELQIGIMNYTVPGLRPMDPLGMTQLQLMQMIPLGGKLRSSTAIAASQANAAAERASETEWEVRGEIAMAFYDLYGAHSGLTIARDSWTLMQQVRGAAGAMYRSGSGTQADLLRAEVEVARMAEDTIRMTAMVKAMYARLDALLDRSATTQFGTPVLAVFDDSIPALSELLALAAARRPMVRAARHDLHAAEAETRLARRELIPDLTVGVQYGQRRGEMGTERMGSLMAGASLPIFASRRQLRMREEAAAMRQMAAAELSVMQADTRGRVAAAHADLTRAHNLVRLYRTSVLPQIAGAATSALSSYRAGGVDFMTALDNQIAVNTYRLQLVELEAEEGKAWAELEMLVAQELVDANDASRNAANSSANSGAFK